VVYSLRLITPEELAVVDRTDGRSTLGVTRRRVLSLPLVLGIAGCTQSASDNDPYIQAMKKDPTFSWQPPMSVTRTINYRPRNWSLEPGPYSYVSVVLIPRDVQGVPQLLQVAEQARTRAGYSERLTRLGGKENGSDFWIRCEVFSASSTAQSTIDAVKIELSAPYVEP
jgi:hypothetical protein